MTIELQSHQSDKKMIQITIFCDSFFVVQTFCEKRKSHCTQKAEKCIVSRDKKRKTLQYLSIKLTSIL